MKWKMKMTALSLETTTKNFQNCSILNYMTLWCTYQRQSFIISIWLLLAISNSWSINYATTISYTSTKKIWCSKWIRKDAIYQDMLKLTNWDPSGITPLHSIITFMKSFSWTKNLLQVKSTIRFGVSSNQSLCWPMSFTTITHSLRWFSIEFPRIWLNNWLQLLNGNISLVCYLMKMVHYHSKENLQSLLESKNLLNKCSLFSKWKLLPVVSKLLVRIISNLKSMHAFKLQQFLVLRIW